MIQYAEKGSGLHAAIRKAGHWLREENGVFVSSDDEAVQAIIDTFDPLPEAKAAKWAQVQAERDRRKFAGYMVSGNRFHSDPDSRTQQLGLVIMGANVPPIQWRTMGGNYVTMTPQLAGAIFTATATGDTLIFAAGEAHRAAIYALTDLSAIESYDFSGGWPEV
jgi:hypothetical protein